MSANIYVIIGSNNCYYLHNLIILAQISTILQYDRIRFEQQSKNRQLWLYLRGWLFCPYIFLILKSKYPKINICVFTWHFLDRDEERIDIKEKKRDWWEWKTIQLIDKKWWDFKTIQDKRMATVGSLHKTLPRMKKKKRPVSPLVSPRLMLWWCFCFLFWCQSDY